MARGPKRVQARKAKGYKAIHRPTRWGNPFPIPEHSRAESLQLYDAWLTDRLGADPSFLEPLRGHDLGCFCALDQPCHGDLILRRLSGGSSGS